MPTNPIDPSQPIGMDPTTDGIITNGQNNNGTPPTTLPENVINPLWGPFMDPTHETAPSQVTGSLPDVAQPTRVSMRQVFVTQGDVPSPLVLQLLDAHGYPVDLTDANVVFHMKSTHGLVADIDTKITLDPATKAKGWVQYNWGSSDLATPDYYHAWFIASGGGKTITFPANPRILIVVNPAA